MQLPRQAIKFGLEVFQFAQPFVALLITCLVPSRLSQFDGSSLLFAAAVKYDFDRVAFRVHLYQFAQLHWVNQHLIVELDKNIVLL